MKCDYELYLEAGGLTGLIPAARRAEALEGHRRCHANGTATCSAFRRRPPRSASACRVCGAVSCTKAECFKALLAAEETLAFRQNLAWRNGRGR